MDFYQCAEIHIVIDIWSNINVVKRRNRSIKVHFISLKMKFTDAKAIAQLLNQRLFICFDRVRNFNLNEF